MSHPPITFSPIAMANNTREAQKNVDARPGETESATACYPYQEKSPTAMTFPPALPPKSDPYDDKKVLQAMNQADDAAEEAARAKAALKEAKKQARKNRKREAKGAASVQSSAVDISIPPLDLDDEPKAKLVTPPVELPQLKVLNQSVETLTATPVPSTPALSATSSNPSIAPIYPVSPPLDASARKYSFDDPVAAAKAAVKSAKRRAQRDALEASRAQASVELPRPQLQTRPPAPQPWEIALDELQYVPSPAKAVRSPPSSIAAFKVPVDRQLLVDFDAPIPACDFDTSHNVAAAIVEELVEKYGRWSITFSDASYRIFITTDKKAAISFKVCEGLTSRVAVVFGDPVCDPIMMEEVIHQFRIYCRSRRWRTAFVGVTEAVAHVAEIKRWTSVQFAVEQIVDPIDNVLLDGTKGKRMMVAVKKLVKDKVLRMYNPADGVDHLLQAYLQGVYDESYAVKEADKGDTTAYSTKLSLFELPRVMTYFYTIGVDGLPNGMAGLMNVGDGRYLLDPVVALPSAPRDTSDFLTLAAMGYLRRRGVRHMSFGLEPLREIGELHGLNAMWHADTRMINAASFDALGFGGKKILHDKFYPNPSKEEKLFLILGSRNCITQLDSAMAITNATHLKASPVLRRLIWMTQAKHTGNVIEAMLGKLVRKGKLPKGSSPSAPGTPTSPSTPNIPRTPAPSQHSGFSTEEDHEEALPSRRSSLRHEL